LGDEIEDEMGGDVALYGGKRKCIQGFDGEI